jgi:hypothetical protein
MSEYNAEQNGFVISVVGLTSLYVMYYCVVEICKDYTNRVIKDEIAELNSEIEHLRSILLSRRVSAGHETELDLS